MIGNSGHEADSSVKAQQSSRGKSGRRSKAKYAADQRARDEYLDRLGIVDDWTRHRYHANQLVRPRIGDPLSHDNLPGLLKVYRDDQFGRLRSMPGWAAVWHRLRKAIRPRIKVTSDIFKTIGKDADAATDALLAQSHVVAELEKRLVEEIALLSAIEVHQRGLLRHEDRAVSAMPAQVMTAARLLELHGLDGRFKPGTGDEFSGELVALLDRYSHRNSVNTEVEERVARRLSSQIEAMGLNSEETGKWDFDASYWTWIPVEYYELIELSGGSTAEQRASPGAEIESASSQTGEVSPRDPIDELANHEYGHAQGHGRIAPMTEREAFAGVVPIGTCPPGYEDIDRLAVSMQLRDNPDLESLIVMPDGSIDDHAWLRFSVPAGPFKLCQMLGQEERLPPYHSSVSLPPYIELAAYGRMLKLGDYEIEDLAKWGTGGKQPAHLREHNLTQKCGNPDLAYAVIRRAVERHYSLGVMLNRLPELASGQTDLMARYWLFLLVGRMRLGQVIGLWGEGFFDDVPGHDPLMKDRGYWLIRRT